MKSCNRNKPLVNAITVIGRTNVSVILTYNNNIQIEPINTLGQKKRDYNAHLQRCVMVHLYENNVVSYTWGTELISILTSTLYWYKCPTG